MASGKPTNLNSYSTEFNKINFGGPEPTLSDVRSALSSAGHSTTKGGGVKEVGGQSHGTLRSGTQEKCTQEKICSQVYISCICAQKWPRPVACSMCTYVAICTLVLSCCKIFLDVFATTANMIVELIVCTD